MQIRLIPFLLFLLACSSQEEKSIEMDKLEIKSIDKEIALNEAYASVGKLKLSDYGFFMGDMKELQPNEGLIAYGIKESPIH